MKANTEHHPRPYSARLEKGAGYLYAGSRRIARFYKGNEHIAARCAALLNGFSLYVNYPELDGYLAGRVVPEWVEYQMWRTARHLKLTDTSVGGKP